MSAPAFSAKTIHEYLFSRDPTAPDAYRLDKAIVGRFCDVLEREITKHASMGPCYRYAFCDIGEDAMDAFFNF